MKHIPVIVGKFSAGLSSLLAVLICTDVFLRYAFDATQVWVIELEWHLFALLLLFGAAYAYRDDQHVRVDVFHQKYTAKRKSLVEMGGILLFLIPWCAMVIYTGTLYAYNSWLFLEGSPDPGGLPARYLIKFAIPVGFTLLLIESLFKLQQSWKVYNQNEA